MLSLDSRAVATALPYAALIDALGVAFAGGFTTPVRAHHSVPVPQHNSATLLLMPAWQDGVALGVKIATVFPDNAKRGLASVHASYLLLDAETDAPLAIMDGTELTLRRTAAASALASRYLSRKDASTLLMVGTGKLAPHLVAAHAAVRPLSRVLVWGRRRAEAERLAAAIRLPQLAVNAVGSLPQSMETADIVCCATLSREPLIQGSWLREGQHLDLVGAFSPEMREADNEALLRSRVFVDTRNGACKEAGEIVQGLAAGVINSSDICGELADLASGNSAGRTADSEITLFKSVGTAIEDLVAARLVWREQSISAGPGSASQRL